MRYMRCLVIIALAFLNGCSNNEQPNNEQDVKDFVAEVKKNAVGKVEPLPPTKPYASETYTAENARSPFSKSKTISVAKVVSVHGVPVAPITTIPRPDVNRKREFLENYPLSSFTMVGILSKNNYYWGLVQYTNGMVYAVQVGDYIGQNSGRITKINDNEIDIDETVPNGKGGWEHANTTLALREEEPTQTPTGSQVPTSKKATPNKTKAGPAKPATSKSGLQTGTGSQRPARQRQQQEQY